MNTQLYSIAAIHSLMRDAFTAGELRRFCRDRPAFRSFLSHFSERPSLEEMIDTVIEQCQTRALFPDLLAAIQEVNPRQYERYSYQFLEKRHGQRVVNLRPLDMTHTFKDREREVQLLCEYLADERVRLVSVVGRGGMGKTALVCHVLTDLEQGTLPIPSEERELLVDGILYLSAKSTGLSLERIYADVGRMLGEPAASRIATRWIHGDVPLVAKVGYLLEEMQQGRYVILLDNLEGYLNKQGVIADEGLRLFLERCLTQLSDVWMIATSREWVRVPGVSRQVMRSIFLREGLPEDDAAELLRDLDPDGELEVRDLPLDELRQAARRTEGIPRALELLTGILARDPTASLSWLLADEHLFSEHVVERLVEEGYHRLGDGERRVMEALAVFDRPVEEKAVAHLLQLQFLDLDIRTALRHLVNSYFVSASRATGEYSLHPLDREYAYQRLPDSDDPNAYNRRNLELRAADFYASIRKPQSEWKTMDDLAPQLNEFKHRVQAGDYDTAARLVQEISPEYLLRWGHAQRVIWMCQQLLAKVSDEPLRNRLLGNMGRAHAHLGQYELAVDNYKRALATARTIGNRVDESRYLGYLGRAYRNLEEYKCSVRNHLQALDIAREMGERRAESANLCNLGITLRDMGHHDESIKHLGGSLIIGGEIGDKHLEGRALMNLGKVYLEIGQTQKAIECHEQALGILREIGYRREEGDTLCSIGWAYDNLGEHRWAIEFYEQGLEIMCEIGDRRGEANHRLSLGGSYLKLGNLEEAIEYLLQAREIAEEVGKHSASHFANRYLTEAYLRLNQLQDARDAIRFTRGHHLPLYNDRANVLHGIVLARLGRTEKARSAFKEAMDSANMLLETTPRYFRAQYTLGLALAGEALLASALTREELLVKARKAYEAALAICSDRGVIADAARLLRELQPLDGDSLLDSIVALLKKPGLHTRLTIMGDDE